AVVADRQPLACKRVMSALRPKVAAADCLVVHVERHRADRFVVRANGRLLELDADDVPPGCWRGRRQLLLRGNAEEVVDEGELTVLEEHRVAAEARALRDDHAL